MQSIALFPCSYTNEARIIGELSNSLHLRVYTDDMLFSDILEQFGIPVEQLKRILYGVTPEPKRTRLEKEKHIHLAICSLEARRSAAPGGFIYYGLHTSLLNAESHRVLKVLVFDEEQGRIQRAMEQEGFSQDVARDYIKQHDQKVSGWTQFLFNEEAYAQSLHDLLISCKNKNLLDITTQIIRRFHDFKRCVSQTRKVCTLPVSDLRLSECKRNWLELF
ncbi:MAG: cytidylate kinase family protein [Desulforhopalus sp.]